MVSMTVLETLPKWTPTTRKPECYGRYEIKRHTDGTCLRATWSGTRWKYDNGVKRHDKDEWRVLTKPT